MKRAVVILILIAACGGRTQNPAAGSPVPVQPTPQPPDVTLTPGAPVPDPSVEPRVAQAAGLMPLRSTGVPDFLAAHPSYDGRGVLIAILDSGLDPGTNGLITTSTGAPKLLDVRDFSGEGRVALAPIASGSDGTLTVGGRAFRGAGRIARLASGPWYAGELRERPLGKKPAADLNGNGSNGDAFPVVVVRAPDGWVAFFDSNLDGSFDDETPLHDYRQGRETIALGTRPITLVANFSEVGGQPVLDIVFDTSAHGTHVAGVAAGHRLYNLPDFNGVAPGAQLIGLKIANNARGGVTVHGSIIRALRYAARFAQQRGLPLVVNLSFGVGNEPGGRAVIDSLTDAFLRDNPQIVLTISAGNDGPGLATVGFPGSADLALSVGATYPGPFAKPTPPGQRPLPDVAGWWSSRAGDLGKPDLLAPGLAYSSVPRWAQGDEIKGGTSFSAPHVAGLVACLMSAMQQERRTATAAEIVRALKATAGPLPGQTTLDQGFGLPRLAAAYRWLTAGHQGSVYVVQAAPGRSAALRRNGYKGVGDTLDVFRVRHVAGLRAAQFLLRSDVAWLSVPVEVDAAPGTTPITVRHQTGALRQPGVYVGTVSAYNPNDSSAGALFRLVSTVIVPHSLAERPLVDDGRQVVLGRVQRYFLAVDRPGATLRVTVSVPDSLREEAIVRLFEPTGQPARSAPDDINLGGEDEAGSSTIVVRAEDLVPGVYELDLLTPKPEPASLTARAEVAPLQLAATDGGIELTNAGSSTVSTRVEQQVVGAVRAFEVTARGVPAESVTVAVPSWADRAEIDVAMDPDLWERFTDFAVTLFDSAGQIVGNTAQNYAFGRLAFAVPPELRGRNATLELFPAYASPDEHAPWTARVAVRFLARDPAPAGPGANVTVVAGGRSRVPLAAGGGGALELPSGYRPVLEATARAGQGSAAVWRGAGVAP
jgi:subtilisin family serine protease